MPSDGKPLPGFNQALASYQARKKSGNVAIASLGKSNSGSSRSGSLLAAFFGGGGGADDEEDSSGVNVASGGDDDAAASAPQPKATTKATAEGRQRRQTTSRQQDPHPAARACQSGRPAAGRQQETIVAALPDRDVPLPLAAPRPQVDVGAVDQSSAGLYATADQPPPADGQPAAIEEVALNIPLPMPRPGNAPPPELDADAAGPGRAIILAAASCRQRQRHGPAAACRDQAAGDGRDRAAHRSIVRRQTEPDEGEDAYTVASRAGSRIGQRRLPDLARRDHSRGEGADPTMLGYAATPRAALVNRAPGTDPAAAVSSGGQDDAKGARPVRKDAKRDAKPKVIAAQPQAARWALDSSYVLANNAKGTKACRLFAHNLVRAAPSEVYTAGFQQGPQVADASALHRQGRHLHDGRALQHELTQAAPAIPAPHRLLDTDQLEPRVAASRASFSISAQLPAFTASSGATQEPPTQITLGSDR